ncbi:MAG: hypothetical protein IPO01_07955 [Chitinophagaceae bacterium]|nr:hypothetical protein [Chitinophagaceae bacterium]
MKQGRKKFLKQLGAGLFAAGLPAIPLAADADESSMDTIDFWMKDCPMMNDTGNALPGNTTQLQMTI